MPLYEYRGSNGHVTERIGRMVDEQPASVPCQTVMAKLHVGSAFRAPEDEVPTEDCGQLAHRVFSVPAAIHFKGSGFYSTDVKARTERKRRPNAGDDLARTHDPVAAEIVR